MIIYADLQSLLLEIKTLRVITLLNGINSGDFQDEVAPRDHENKLESFEIFGRSRIHGDVLGRAQLCWLVNFIATAVSVP